MSTVAYFDNAATTFPKPECVYDFADSFYRSSGGNIGRGNNTFAAAAGVIAQNTKENLRTLYGCPAHEVIFTASATDALNRILLGLDLIDGEHIYISPFEHNAVTRPLNHLVKARGINLHVLPYDKQTYLPLWNDIDKKFSEASPRLLVLTHASNVCGAVVPVEKICRMAKRYGATTLIDISQTAGLLSLNLASDLYDFVVFAGHKTLYGPFGVGGFFCKKGTRLKPVLFGGNGINSVQQDMPENIVQMEEIGSQNTYAIAGLKASTDWILKQGMQALHHRENENEIMLCSILANYGCISVIGNKMECERIGVVSTLFEGLSPDEAEMVLGRFGVAVRSGIQCAPFAHEFLGTLPKGTIRFSVSALTSEADFFTLRNALDCIDAEL